MRKRIVESFVDFNNYSDRADAIGGRGRFATPSNFLDKQKVDIFFGFGRIQKFKIEVELQKEDNKTYDILVGVQPFNVIDIKRKNKYINGNGEFMVYYYSDGKISKEEFKILPMFDVSRMKSISVKEFLINLFLEYYNENIKIDTEDEISISGIKMFNASIDIR